MSSYSATMLVKGLVSENIMAGSGSFKNINIDGRLSLDSAIELAKENFKKEAELRNSEYLGFAIEKTTKFVNYKNPLIIDNNIKAIDVEYLL